MTPPIEQDIEYSDGLHLKDSLLWFDAPKAKELCFISNASIDGAYRHKKIIATNHTAEILKAIGSVSGRGRRAHEPQILLTPYRRSFAIGTLKLELFPSGMMLGASSLLVERDGKRIVYAGYIDMNQHQLADRLEARRCDTLILPCPSGLKRVSEFFEREKEEQALIQFVQNAFNEKHVPVIFTPVASIAPRIAHLLTQQGFALRLHGKILAVLKVMSKAGLPIDLSRVHRYRGSLDSARRPEVVIWPIALRESKAISKLSRACKAIVSEQVVDPELIKKTPYEQNFSFSTLADHRAMLDYVQACQPKHVVLTGCENNELSDAISKLGIAVFEVGPKEQLDLFKK